MIGMPAPVANEESLQESEELRQRVQALEESERQIKEFLATLGHELRNPLAPIRNAVTLMKTGGLNASMIEWYATLIDRQVAHLTRLVDDLLDMSRITNGKVMLQREPVEISSVVSGAVDACRPLIDSRQHTLEIVLPDGPLWVEADPTRLSQIVLNLLNNAAKYTPEGGTIQLTVDREGRDVVIRVRDNGIGIPADLLPKVFDLFTQGDRSLDRAQGGLGIGLALVRKLVEMHGGSVKAHSAGSGRGSDLIVRLPSRPAPAAATDGREVEPPNPAVSRRVLVVDDNRDAADSMTVLLEIWGYEVRTAYDGPAALGMAAAYQPDTVLLDIGLPAMDGYTVARRLRDVPGCETAMLVAVSGYGQDDDLRRSREAGFDHHLTKPVDPLKLEALLHLPAQAG
jgi:CheY-like chemotaxis protein/nitrogen-specific signal transduction histidine kinase